MLGALRDEVVPEVLGGRPADAETDAEADAVADAVADAGTDAEAAAGTDDQAAAVADAPAPGPAQDEAAEDAAAADEPAPASAQADVDDTGDVTRTAAPDAPAAVDPSTAPDLRVAPADLDEVCAAAVDVARAAAVEEAGAAVGEHLGVEAEDALTVTHSFATTDPAYTGWRWAVTVARAEGVDVVTVDEVVLLPGAGALLAPAWVPYSDRVQPGDLGAGDLLPPAPDDVRLVPAWNDPETEVPEELWDELFLGRPRVLSLDGRADAAERWYEGDTGPRSPRALAAPGECAGCGFLVPLAGALRRGFGVCANAQAPDDGRVVALGHGCGAHSETPVELTHAPATELVVDDVEFDYEDAARSESRDAGTEDAGTEDAGTEDAGTEDAGTEDAGTEDAGTEDAPGTGDPAATDPLPDPADEQQAEELGHS